MAYYSLFPEIDSTIYSHPDRDTLNTGGDEILEIVKEKHTDQKYYPSRVLIKFKNEEIKETISSVIGSSTFNNGTTKVSLNLFQTEPKNLNTIFNLDVFAVSQSWHEGKGRYTNIPTSSNGCSWLFRDDSTSKTIWPTGSVTGLTFSSGSYVIGKMPSASAHKFTIGNVSYVPVLSSSLFTSTDTEVFVEISSSVQLFNINLSNAIAASSSAVVSASMLQTGWPTVGGLVISASQKGTTGNLVVTTSSIAGNDQAVFSKHSTMTNFSLQGGTDDSSPTFYPGSTGAIDTDLLTAGGGTWWTGSNYTSTQQFLNADTLDTNFEVINIIQRWSSSLFASQTYNQGNLPSGIENHGFLIKQPNSVEHNTSSSFGEMQYFSVDTHTIFPPKLTFKWDDSTHEYTSQAKNTGELNVSLYRNKKEYNQNDVALFRVNVRDKYPIRTFATSSNYLNVGYFTANSFYSIRDAYSEEEIIPFDDNFTKMSADAEGMYFKIYMKGLQPERYYRLLFKHVNNDGTTIYDDNYIFKVIR